MKSLEDLEKKINSELTTKINNTEIKHNQIYIEIDKDDIIDVTLFLKTNQYKLKATIWRDLSELALKNLLSKEYEFFLSNNKCQKFLEVEEEILVQIPVEALDVVEVEAIDVVEEFLEEL